MFIGLFKLSEDLMETSELCRWLHEQLEQLPLIKFPFKLEILPENGIYFFYEDGEFWGHGGEKLRIVRVGTHRDGNFRSRIREHFLLDKAWMNFDERKPKPSDRSIFRKNIGRALLNIERDNYLKIWEIDFTVRKNQELWGDKRDVEKEKKIEEAITKILRERFSFRFIILDPYVERMGSKGLESSLIGTLAHCKLCKPSPNWLGKYSPVQKIREGKLWLVQHLKSNPINEKDKEIIIKAVEETKKWLKIT
ncbi:MAG: hypothetical protein NZ931_00780 [Aigarchaeota archaeon]|nr:hypothetical protein [Aigarchaeota archaeon]